MATPLIALQISYDSIACEVERGALLAGKALGLIAVMAIAIAASLTISSVATIVRLRLTGLLLGSVFVAIGMMISVASPRAGQASAVAIGVWLVATVHYDLALRPYFVTANPGDAFRIFNLAGLENAAPISGLDGIANTLPFSAT